MQKKNGTHESDEDRCFSKDKIALYREIDSFLTGTWKPGGLYNIPEWAWPQAEEVCADYRERGIWIVEVVRNDDLCSLRFV